MTFIEFEKRCMPAAEQLDGRLCRYISSPQEHDLALPTAMPLILLLLELYACQH